MFGNHWMRLVCNSLVDRYARLSSDHASRPRARPFKHRVLRLEMCEDRSLLSGGGMLISTIQCPTTDHSDPSSDSSRQHLVSSGASNCPTGSNGGSDSDVDSISSASPLNKREDVSGATVGLPNGAQNAVMTTTLLDQPAVAPIIQQAASPAAGTPAQNKVFVQHLYKDVLGRTADSAGLTAWSMQLNNGTTTSTVAGIFWESVEHRGIQVDSYYLTYLHRASEAAGRLVWVNFMTTGMTEETVIATFLNSDEYKNANPLNNAFVVGLYRDVLGRSPDSAGQTAWTAALASSALTPAQVVQAFIDSHERHLNLVDAYYKNLLGRAADSAGETFWTGQLDSAAADDQAAAEVFLSSPEYYTKVTGGFI